MSDVTPDGSPVDVYLALPAGETPDVIDGAIPPRASILDLGCGVGRISGPLVERGHRVTGVDESEQMLCHARPRGIETVCGRIENLDLRRRFDVVLLLSHLVNTCPPEQRRAFLATCARHVKGDGLVVVERHDPQWLTTTQHARNNAGAVQIEYVALAQHEHTVEARVVYALGGRTWTQEFEAAVLSVDQLDAEARAVGLTVTREITTGLIALRPTPAAAG